MELITCISTVAFLVTLKAQKIEDDDDEVLLTDAKKINKPKNLI